MKGLTLFLGCVIPNRYPGIEMATRLCLAKLNIDCTDLEGASCCPAPGVFRSFDEPSWLAVAGRNIVLSEKLQRDILTICNGCFASLADANHMLKSDPVLRERTNEYLAKIGKEFKGNIEVRHIIEYLYRDIGTDIIRSHIEKPLKLRVAVHYGCHLLKPSKSRELGDSNRPEFFDELIECLGATSVDYPDKMECCGAGGGVRSALKDESLKMADHKLSRIKEAVIDCIVNACPFCHMQLDAGQEEIKQRTGVDYNIPVLHYTQLMGLALGFPPEALGIDLNVTNNGKFIEKIEEML
ncbi:CoB--CoM heterodisulfide reductase subunit B [Methanolobus halotolerans]|uniref:CoB--CoM heterodisulfide reductase subunit B n=1 Tax=Methanolobus halotolerans TaxID=2052935 RepID=A0A4E0PWC4_9EURY|nr:CoB--CoM heterodisulfide reductase subunit B [Methanolobus halotolerans]TGC09765.1 CoB--CoM heterodisulfide reductase subunit B [Methanolobus halotolerans]